MSYGVVGTTLLNKNDTNEEIPKELIDKLGEVGLLGTAFPEKYGGGGFGEYGFCIAQEEVVRACGSTAAFIGAHISIGTNAILYYTIITIPSDIKIYLY